MKLAVFSGQIFWFDGHHYSTNEAFVKFVTSFSAHFEQITFCDVLAEERTCQAYVLDPGKAEVFALPYFSVYSFWKNVLVIYPKIYRSVKDNIHRWDMVWLHSPHPVSLIFALACRKLNKPVLLFVRQNLKVQVGYRNRGARRILAVSAAAVLEYMFRWLSREVLTFTVGNQIFDTYKKGRWVYQTSVSLVSEKDFQASGGELAMNSEGPLILLSVGRLDPEKGTIYLIRALGDLVASGRKNIILKLAGSGTEEASLKWHVNNRRLSEYVRFVGYVPHGDELFTLYRESDIFVQPSLTEGCPQSLFEAMACGLPVVATKVGGIPYLIRHGENGLLVDPASPDAICGAVRRLINDSTLRTRLITNGLSTARDHTLEAERDRMVHRIEAYLRQIQSGRT